MSQTDPKVFDYIVIGAGIAGASVAYELAMRGGSVLILEAENHPGYHSTGRSATFFIETYGNEVVRSLTKFSRIFIENPPPGFTDYPLLTDSGALYVARQDQLERLHALYQSVKDLSRDVRLEDVKFAAQKVPKLNIDYVEACLWDPDARELDAASLLQGYLKLAKAKGAQLQLTARVESLNRDDNVWQVNTDAGQSLATTIVNAAGAWADIVAKLAGTKLVGLQPKKRTACIVPAPEGMMLKGLPLVIDIDEEFYFKADGGNLLISPADETEVEPMDAYSETMDVALAIDRVTKVVDIDVMRVNHEWAGLRSFVADKSPVIGFDPGVENFFWLAGQGGYGIQLSPGAAQLAASMMYGENIPAGLTAMGLDLQSLAPSRCQSN